MMAQTPANRSCWPSAVWSLMSAQVSQREPSKRNPDLMASCLDIMLCHGVACHHPVATSALECIVGHFLYAHSCVFGAVKQTVAAEALSTACSRASRP